MSVHIDDARLDLACPPQSKLQEVLRREGIPLRRQHEVNRFASRINSPIEVSPAASDARVGLVDPL